MVANDIVVFGQPTCSWAEATATAMAVAAWGSSAPVQGRFVTGTMSCQGAVSWCTRRRPARRGAPARRAAPHCAQPAPHSLNRSPSLRASAPRPSGRRPHWDRRCRTTRRPARARTGRMPTWCAAWPSRPGLRVSGFDAPSRAWWPTRLAPWAGTKLLDPSSCTVHALGDPLKPWADPCEPARPRAVRRREA